MRYWPSTFKNHKTNVLSLLAYYVKHNKPSQMQWDETISWQKLMLAVKRVLRDYDHTPFFAILSGCRPGAVPLAWQKPPFSLSICCQSLNVLSQYKSLISLLIADIMCFCHVRGSDPGLQLDATHFCGLRKIFLQLFWKVGFMIHPNWPWVKKNVLCNPIDFRLWYTTKANM